MPFKRTIIASATLLLVGLLLTTSFINQVTALSGSQFHAGHIIDDANFYKSNAISVSQIQSFLNSKVPTCDTNGTTSKSYYYNSSSGRVNNSSDTWVTTSRATYGARYDKWYGTTIAAAPYTCLKNYKQDTPAENAESGICGYLPARSGRSAAYILADVSAACGINPEVLIVLLQKEQGLVTDDWPWDNEYQKATGYGCPDTTGCNSAYYGFFNQVYHAARQYRLYRANPTNYNFIAGQNNQIAYSPDASCGSSSVYILNQATAGLYNYTPYQPNAAALSNIDGTGDGCSSYGNRNFWRYYSEWFGSPITLKYDSLQTPRWLQTTQSLQKVNLATGDPVDGTLAAGQQIYFDTKITIDGVAYLRTKHDTAYGIDKGIPYSELAEIPVNYVSLTQPRWFTTKQDLYKQNPTTGQPTGGTVPAGTQIYFPTKFDIGGQTYLRTQHDTNLGLLSGIPLASLDGADITYENFLHPRWMVTSKNTATIDLTGAASSTPIPAGTQLYFDHKVVVNGYTFVSNGIPSGYTGVPLGDLQEIPYRPLKFPRYMTTASDIYKKDPRTGQNVGSVIPAGTTMFFPTAINVNGQEYLRTQYETNHNLSEGILLSDLGEYFVNLVGPRNLVTTSDIYEKNPTTGHDVGSVIPAGTTMFFPTKTNVGGTVYLRPQSDNDANNNVGIPLTDLAESYVSMVTPRMLQVQQAIYKTDPTLSRRVDSLIPAGTKIYFGSKVMIDGKLFLRTQHDTDLNYNKVIPYSDLR